jgi:5-aminopentanamidase
MGGGEAIVACCQVRLAVGDVAGNRAAVDAAVRDAAARDADVVVVPELAPSGYVFAGPEEARALAEPADGPTLTGWHALAAELGIVLVGGFC